MNDREQVTSEIDRLVDKYYAQHHPVETLLDIRKELAVNLYRLTAHAKTAYGEAGLTYLVRKFKIAEVIVNGRDEDIRKGVKPRAVNLLEHEASALQTVFEAQQKEIWADAALEAFKAKVDAAKQVLASLQQEISYEAYERKSTHQQSTGK